jgi:solute carrier family 25 folate transporter 32
MSQISTKAVEGHRTPWHYNNTWDAARQMYKGEGIKAFYSGLAPALLGLTHVAIQFPLYEYLKLKFTGVEMGAAPTSQGSNSVGVLAATCISKICATTATYPHEVLRTRLQTQQRGIPSSDGMINKPRYQGIIRTCRLILYEEGWTAFYSGMGTNLIRAVPAAMTTMLTFETLKSIIVRMQIEEENEHVPGTL